MKMRLGFVSNSSSSSYLIAVKISKPCPHCGRGDIDILSLIEDRQDFDEETHLEALGLEQVMKKEEENLRKYEEHGTDEYQISTKLLSKRKQLDFHVDNGYKVAKIEISNHNNLKEVFDQMVKTGSIIVIEQNY